MVELDIPEETEEEREIRIREFRTAAALRIAPELAMHVRSIVVSGKIETGETLREWTAPMRITASDDLDLVFSQLVDWRMYWQRYTATTEPTGQPGVWRGAESEVVGFAAGTTPQLAQILVRHQTSWLLEHAEWINTHPSVAGYQEDVIRMLWALRSKYPTSGRKERDVLPRDCPICGQPGVQAEWYVEGEPSSVRVECHLCGHRIPVTKKPGGRIDEWLPTVETVTDPIIVTEERIALLAKPLLRASEAAYLVNRSTRQIQRWMREGLPTYKHPWQKDRHVKLAEVRHWIATRKDAR